MMKLLKYNKKYILKNPFYLFSLISIIIIFSVCSTSLSFLNKYVILYLKEKNTNMFITFSIIMTILGIFTSLWYLFKSFYVKYFSAKIILSIRNDLINSVIKMQKENKKDVSEYFNWLTKDAKYIEKNSIEQSINLVSRFFNLFFGFIAIFLVEWKIGLFIFVIILIFLLLNNFVYKKNTEYKKILSSSKERLNKMLINNMNMLETAHLTNRKAYFKNKIKRDIDRHYENSLNFHKGLNYKIMLFEILSNGSNLFLLIFITLLMILNNNIGLNIYLTASLLSGNVVYSINSIINLMINIKSNKSIFQKTVNLLNDNERKSLYYDYNHIKNISFDKILFYYDENNVIFKDLSLEFPERSKSLICGMNGKGKSTLMKLIMRIEKPINGKVITKKWNNKNENIYHSISYLKSSPSFFPGTILENITFKKDISKKNYDKLKYIFSKINIDFSYEELNEKNRIDNISDGEKQKVSLARALFRNINTIIIDEGLSSIYVEDRKKILKHILNSNLRVFHITHSVDKKFLNLYDKTILL